MTMEITRPRDQRAKLALEAAVREALKSPPPVDVSVSAHDNNSFEPSFYVRVTMPSRADFPGSATRNQLVVKMMDALAQLDDDRFVYLYFDPYDESAADPPDEEDDLGQDADLL